jgi:hypothetical protein
MSAPDFAGTDGQPLLQLCVTAWSAAVPGYPVCSSSSSGASMPSTPGTAAPIATLPPPAAVAAAAERTDDETDVVVHLRLLSAYPSTLTGEHHNGQSPPPPPPPPPPPQGRVRIVVEYDDGMAQVIQLYIQPDAPELIQAYTDTLRTKQFHDDPADPFHRTAALLNWNRDAAAAGTGLDDGDANDDDDGDGGGSDGGQILQESRAWIAGLSDECGAGPAVALASKNLWAPQREELALLERYVNEVLWGQVRETAGIFRSNVSVSLRVCWPELVLTARRFQEQALKK